MPNIFFISSRDNVKIIILLELEVNVVFDMFFVLTDFVMEILPIFSFQICFVPTEGGRR